MTFSIYDASCPVFRQGLKNLSGMLAKAEAHAGQQGIKPEELLEARLHPEMFSLTRQVQIACDHAKGGCARLAGVDVPVFADTETTIAELQLRISNTQAFINGLSATEFNGAEGRDIELKFPWATQHFKGSRYLTYWALPNFFFHVTTAYDILRHKGVALGKADFLGH